MAAEEGKTATAPPTDEETEFTLANSDVCTKYREAGRIAALALQGIKSQVRTLARSFSIFI
jgi:hypothetical protein